MFLKKFITCANNMGNIYYKQHICKALHYNLYNLEVNIYSFKLEIDN